YQKNLEVWDILIRIFHWSLVASFIIAYLTSTEKNEIHNYAGYTVLGLIIFRVVWGFWGSRHARFSNFVTSFSTVVRFVKSLFSKKPKRYMGHNPLGGWMVIAMLITLFMLCYSGIKLNALQGGGEPLALQMPSISLISSAYAKEDIEQFLIREPDEVGEDYWKEMHAQYFYLMLILIALHLAEVLVSSLLYKENFVKEMWTGKKAKDK
ncbi:MAG: cytochrome b/b6 domain-containing protein, partial [Methylococcales bacterium]